MWEKSNFLMCFNTFFNTIFRRAWGKRGGMILLNIIFLSSLSLNLLCTSYILALFNV